MRLSWTTTRWRRRQNQKTMRARDDSHVCKLWLKNIRQGLDPPAGKGFKPVILLLINCNYSDCQSVYSPLSLYECFLFNLLPQLCSIFMSVYYRTVKDREINYNRKTENLKAGHNTPPPHPQGGDFWCICNLILSPTIRVEGVDQ